jgi:hypothetical protein
VTAAESRADLIQRAASQPETVQQLACVAGCERAYPLVNRLGSVKSRLVSRYAIEELWDRVLWAFREDKFLGMIDRLPEVSAWDPREPAYYAMSSISIVAHTRKFFETSRLENLAYVVGTLFDLAAEYDKTLGSVGSSKMGIREAEIACQHRVYALTSQRSGLELQAKRLVRTESLLAALTYEEPVGLFCSLHGWLGAVG